MSSTYANRYHSLWRRGIGYMHSGTWGSAIILWLFGSGCDYANTIEFLSVITNDV